MATKTAQNCAKKLSARLIRSQMDPKLSRDSESVHDQLAGKALLFHFKAFDEIRLCERV